MLLYLSVALVLVLVLTYWFYMSANCIKVYRFYREGCGWCRKSKDEWQRFKSDCTTRMVKCYDVDTDDQSTDVQELYKNMGGEGVPHIVKVHPDGRRYVYDGDRSAASLARWLGV